MNENYNTNFQVSLGTDSDQFSYIPGESDQMAYLKNANFVKEEYKEIRNKKGTLEYAES